MVTDYDEVDSDVREAQDNSLEALQSTGAPVHAASSVNWMTLTPGTMASFLDGIYRRGIDRTDCPSGRVRIHLLLMLSGPAPLPNLPRRAATPTGLNAKARQYACERSCPIGSQLGQFP